MATGTTSFVGVVLLPKLQGKPIRKIAKWCFRFSARWSVCSNICLGRWRNRNSSLLRQETRKLNANLQEAIEVKITRRFRLTDSLRGVIQSICNIEPMFNISGMALFNDILAKFERFYWDIRFMERNAIVFWLSSQTFPDFTNVAQFTDSLKRDCIRLKKLHTIDLSN